MSQPTTFTLPYGDLERLIADLVGAEPAKVRSRYRKLRLRPFPDDIQSGTGVRVQYGLRRVLAIAAVFQLNNLYLAQGHAAAIVEASWPELCRALLVAAYSSELLPLPDDVPASAGAILEIGCGAVAAGELPLIDAAAVRLIDPNRLAVRPSIALNLNQLLQALLRWASGRGEPTRQALIEDLRSVAADYGWGQSMLKNGTFDDQPRAASFLEDGPYLTRALAFLEAQQSMFNAEANPAAHLRLQSIYDYLEFPAPIDAAKAALGLSEDVRLARLLHFYARDMGLATKELMPAVWNLDNLQGRALDLVKMAISEIRLQTLPSRSAGDGS